MWQAPTTSPETDEELRARIRYVAGGTDEPVYEKELARSSGEALDEIAWRYNLKRRKVVR